jgi:hypothetical protein
MTARSGRLLAVAEAVAADLDRVAVGLRVVPAPAHHCLLGCLACQRCCPANPRLEISDSGVTFMIDETRVLMGEEASAGGQIEDGIRRKLEDLGLLEDNVLGRNLRALIERRGHAR